MSNVPLGVVLGLSGSIAINTGNNLQSLGMYRLEKESQYEKDSEDGEVSICNSTTWILGTTIFVAGALLNFASYGFAPQSTLASLEAIQFVTNLFLGKVLLKKMITRRMYIGTFFTVVGTVMAVLFSSKKGAVIEVIPDLILLWENWGWLTYIICIALLGLMLAIGNNFYKRKGKERKVISKMAVIYAVFSALFGTLSVVFAKVLAELLELQTKGIDVFSHWFTYITLLSWLVLMIYWLLRLNNALALYNPLLIIPLLQVSFIFFAIVSGGIYFQEFNYMQAHQWVGFNSGVVCMFTGIYLLVPPEDLLNCTVQTGRPRRSTIKERQRIYSEYLMIGASKTNHMEFERRLTDCAQDEKTCQSYITHSVVAHKNSQSGVEKEENKNPVEVHIENEKKLTLIGSKMPMHMPSVKRQQLVPSIPLREISKSASSRAAAASSSSEGCDDN